MNSSYGRMDPKPVLYYLLRHHHVDEAIWLLSKGAKANCLLRWEFMVQERLMTAKELEPFYHDVMERKAAATFTA